MTARHVALIRGINVGDAKRVAMADLRKLAHRAKLKPLARRDWGNEALAVGKRMAYLCSEGILESPLAKAVGRALGDAVTSRNWATTLKLHAIA